MRRGLRRYFSFVLLLFLCACAPVTMKQLAAQGKTPLSGKQLHELVASHSLHLEAIDFNAEVQFQPNGHLTATSHKGVKDSGKWSITANDQLCMKFDRWYFGDQKCYNLVHDQDSLIFFTANGARYYTGKALAANNGEDTQQNGSTPDAAPVPDEEDVPRPPPLTNAERAQTLINLARNCPDCNLAGADLHGAQLVAANLAGADLSGADLHDANLRRAKLTGANLSGAKLVRTNLAGADLTNCDLSNADLTGSNLIRATVTGANLTGANLSGAYLESIQGYKGKQ